MRHAILSLIVLIAVFQALAARPALALEQITVSYPGPAIFFLPVEVARQRGFFMQQNLDVKLILTKSEVDRAALASGDIDFTLRAGSTVLSAARGLPVRILFVGTIKPFWALVVRPEVNSVKELKGKVMGVAGLAGSHHITTKAILRQNGLDPEKDAVFKVLNVGARIPALLSGSMDAGLLDYNEAFLAKKSGFKILLNAADHYSILSQAIGANLKKMREEPEQVKRFLKANVEGIKFMRENRQTTIDILMRWIKLEREAADAIYQLSINNFTRDGTIEESVLKPVIDQQLAESKIKEVPLSQVADFSPLHQVLKEGR